MKAVAAAAAACVLLATAGCQPASPGAGRPIVVALASSPTNLDPGVGLDEASQRVHALLYSALLKFDDTLRIVPDLASRFETTDYQHYVAAIPAGVRFHDGREMTSEDVAYTFRRFLDPALVSGRKGAYRDLAGVDIVDRYTVVFRLKEPSGSFPANLTNIGIVPSGSAATLGAHPVGSGPYAFVEFLPDDHVTLVPFDRYYRGAPANAGIVFKVVPDDTMRGLELRKGDVDIVVNDLTPDLFHGLAADPAVTLSTGPGCDYAYVGINLRDPILSDRRVRLAIGYAIDRAAIVDYLRRGQARETVGIVPPMSWAYSADVPHFTYDPARAKQLLDEAGYRDPDGDGPQPRLHLSFKTSTSEPYRLQAAVLQQQLAQVGIQLDLRSYEFATFFADVIAGNFQLYTLVFTGGSVADPDILRRVFHSAQAPPVGFNRGHYANPEVDRLLDQATRALTEPDRKRDYMAAERIIAADAPIISLWVRDNVAAARTDITGVHLSPIGDFDFLRDVARTPPSQRVE
jgi:peptide/nickel transport system substrate-binding protein